MEPTKFESPPAYPPEQPGGYFQGYPPDQVPPGQPPIMTQPQYQQAHHTTVVVTQPAMVLKQAPRNWSTGLCGCFDDCGVCCMGWFCPCFLLFDVSSRMGEGCCFPCCCPNPLLGLRIKLRVQENIQGSLLDDYCEVQCCAICVLCQLARELKNVGN